MTAELVLATFTLSTLTIIVLADYIPFMKNMSVASLLEHFVRSPVGTSLLLGMDDGQEMIDLEVRDPSLQGVASIA